MYVHKRPVCSYCYLGYYVEFQRWFRFFNIFVIVVFFECFLTCKGCKVIGSWQLHNAIPALLGQHSTWKAAVFVCVWERERGELIILGPEFRIIYVELEAKLLVYIISDEYDCLVMFGLETLWINLLAICVAFCKLKSSYILGQYIFIVITQNIMILFLCLTSEIPQYNCDPQFGMKRTNLSLGYIFMSNTYFL